MAILTNMSALYGSYGIIIALVFTRLQNDDLQQQTPSSIGVSAVLGWFLILCLLFSIQDYEATINTPTGQPVAQIFLDTVGEGGAIALLVIVYTHQSFATHF